MLSETQNGKGARHQSDPKGRYVVTQAGLPGGYGIADWYMRFGSNKVIKYSYIR
jgi:hypothetical protein